MHSDKRIEIVVAVSLPIVVFLGAVSLGVLSFIATGCVLVAAITSWF